MKKIINAAVCDARGVQEESLQGFEAIEINASELIADARAKALLEKYHVTVNAASILEVPEDEADRVKTVNGKETLGPDADGTGVILVVNGKVTLENGSLAAAQSYAKIQVNGTLLMPESFKGKLPNLSVNGCSIYYPDGATLLKSGQEIDSLFVLRANRPLYHCPGRLFLLDNSLDVTSLLEKGVRFSAKKLIITEHLLPLLVSQVTEETEILRVPDGTRRIAGDVELTARMIRKYGSKLCVSGDLTISDVDALAGLEYLYCAGTVRLDQRLAEAFDELEAVYGELQLVDPDACYLFDRASVRIDSALLRRNPGGVRVSDCANVKISDDVTPEEIVEKLQISDCAIVTCTKEQESAVGQITQDVAMICPKDDAANGGFPGGLMGGIFGKTGNDPDTQVINVAEYHL